MKNIFPLLVLLLITGTLLGQFPELKMQTINDNSNLSSQSVKCLTQDTSGYIWIGTVNGLSRYNGYEIENYKKSSNDSMGLASNNITSLYTDSHGDIWVGTRAGLCRYVAEYNSFERIVQKNYVNGAIREIKENNTGQLYIAAGGALYTYLPEADSSKLVIRLDDGIISSFLFDENNHIWIGMEDKGGLYHFDPQGNRIKRYLRTDSSKNTISHNTISDLALKDSDLYIATYGGGLNVLDIENNTFRYYLDTGFYEKRIKFINTDNYNRLWVITLNGISVWNEQSREFHLYSPDDADQYAVKENPEGIIQDKQDNFWVYYFDKGITVSMKQKGFDTFNADPGSKRKIFDPHITAVCEDENANLWLGNFSGGIDVMFWEKNEVKHFQHQKNQKYSLGKGTVFEIFRGSDNIMWVGTYTGGLQYYNPDNENFISYKHDPADSLSIANNAVRDITEDGRGNLWIALRNKGVDKFNKKTETFRHFNEKNSGLSNNWAFEVLYSSKNNLWVGTAWGLNILRDGKDEFQYYLHSEEDTTTISDNEVLCLHEDENGKIWIGTSDGLNRYNRNKDEFIRYRENFNGIYICSIEEDEQNRLWLSTRSGLIRFNPRSGKTINFDSKDGLQSNEFSPGASYKNHNGRLFFGGFQGINVFKPGEIQLNKQPPEVIISGIKLFHEEIYYHGKHDILDTHISVADTIKLKYNQNILTFEYTALNMIQPEENRYAYMMEGFDESWNYVEDMRQATYTNLPPGEYTFKVKAANNDGFWSNTEASLVLQISPPWYLTIWFFIALGIGIVFLLWLIYWLRTARLKRRNALLEQNVAERTQELERTNHQLLEQTQNLNNLNRMLEERQQKIEEQSENLKHANEALKRSNAEKDKLFSIIAHDLRSPFNTVLGFSQVLLREISNKNYDKVQSRAEYIYKSAYKVYDLLENLLQWARSQTEQIEPTPEIVNVNEIIRYNVDLITETANQKNIEVTTTEESGLEVFVDPKLTGTALRNVLSNAVKFTPKGGKVTIYTEKREKEVVISVADTGVGISDEAKENIFNVGKRTSIKGTEGESGSGLGLVVSKEFIELNGGKIWITDNIPQGTIFSFSLPLSSGISADNS